MSDFPYHFFDKTPYSSHYQILQRIPPHSHPVLEIGCATGYLSQIMQAQGCQVYAIEIDPQAAEQARPYCQQIWLMDLETTPLPLAEMPLFERIILADIIEHLRDPLSLIKSLKTVLAPQGRMIISVPNIVNWSIRKEILLGRFEYQQVGILDRTHLRFYTFKTIRTLLEQAGLRILEWDVTPNLPLPWKHLRYHITRFWPNLLAFQYIIVVES